MSNIALYEYKKLTPSYIAYNTGQVPQEPTFIKKLVNVHTGDIYQFTDIDLKRRRREEKLIRFIKTYDRLFEKQSISLLSFVVSQDKYEKISQFINTIKRKLKRKELDVYGYIWVRDCGEKVFKKHYHVLLATDFLTKKSFQELFSKLNTDEYNVERAKTKYGMIEYLAKKGIYAKKSQHSFGTSRQFKKPVKTI